MLDFHQEPIIQQIKSPLLEQKGVCLFVKREDLIHPFVSGNKWRKLKYNLLEAKRRNVKMLLTFGGAFSNHIYATAAAAKEKGFESIGIIRGEELANKELNKTLQFATDKGMKLMFVNREDYRIKAEQGFIKRLNKEYGDFYLIPEGGTNPLAIKGCLEILDEQTAEFDYICSSVGTGGTLTGLILGSQENQQVIGFSSLKGSFLHKEVENYLMEFNNSKADNWSINNDYHFGGYAKITSELMEFIQLFESQQNILLDQVYTGKMMYGIYDLVKKEYFKPNSKILAIHTGGLQGRESLLSSD